MYWRASERLSDLYPALWSEYSYNYASPPTIAQAFSLVRWLPWPVALVTWQLVLWTALWYATRPFTLPVVVAGYLGLALDIPLLAAPIGVVLIGNAGMLLTAGAVATVRDPRAVAIPVLTKVGPGIALLWHAPRQWGPGLAVSGIVLASSVAYTPSAWPEWIAFVAANVGQSPIGELAIPFAVRAPVGAAIVLLARRRQTPWLVPIGAGLAIPADYGLSWVTVWVGALGLWARSRQ